MFGTEVALQCRCLLDEHNRLQLEMNANAGYEHSEGMPETPPPTYDVIARQTSYVSHISQTSDQSKLWSITGFMMVFITVGS